MYSTEVAGQSATRNDDLQGAEREERSHEDLRRGLYLCLPKDDRRQDSTDEVCDDSGCSREVRQAYHDGHVGALSAMLDDKALIPVSRDGVA